MTPRAGEIDPRSMLDCSTAPSPGPAAILEVVEWLAGNDCHELDDAGLIAGLALRLTTAGLPIDRLALHLRTLHPEILGRTVAWAPNEAVEIRNRDYSVLTEAEYVGSPLRQVMDTGQALIVHVDDRREPSWTHLDIFLNRRLAELFIVPLNNADGPVSAASFCTSRPHGFSINERAALERIVPPLRNICELRTLRQMEQTLLDTYVGATTARRILSGRIRRNQVESLEAVLMLCDLRGFTQLSNRLPGKRVLELLDAYFDRIVPAIIAGGGEVLKFMGDAVLAFFHREDAETAAAAALQSAFDGLDQLARFSAPDAELHAGIALHYGEVSYGNIGSGQRLDFTVIGPDVNLLSRIETVCGATGRPLLMSGRFAGLLASGRTASVGRHQLKGFAEAVELFTHLGPI
ncbi:MAG: adenylate/guanylate cyclase domain-containing protein [Dongiaceae bacterium]